MKEKALAFLTLFTSASTLICCALPALFVALGFGAAFAGLITKAPQLVWFSEHKLIVFGLGGILLALGGYLQWHARNMTCPTDPRLAESCKKTRKWSLWTYYASVALYLIGAAFAFLIPLIGSSIA